MTKPLEAGEEYTSIQIWIKQIGVQKIFVAREREGGSSSHCSVVSVHIAKAQTNFIGDFINWKIILANSDETVNINRNTGTTMRRWYFIFCVCSHMHIAHTEEKATFCLNFTAATQSLTDSK